VDTLDRTQEMEMDKLDHERTHSEAHESVDRVIEMLRGLRSSIGPDPFHRESEVLARPVHDDRIQAYLPGYSVAGEGRCLCEAYLETILQLESLLEVATEHKDWGILPKPDRSLATKLRLLKNKLYFRLFEYLDRRIAASELREAESVKSALAAAL
jgi:hypothetical protein